MNDAVAVGANAHGRGAPDDAAQVTRRRTSPLLVLACAVLPLVVSARAHAVDNRFDPGGHANGGAAVAHDATYEKECGSCHLPYPSGLLPARSWSALINRADDHFGERLSLAPALARELEDTLVAHAADRSERAGSRLLLDRLSPDSTPLRITAVPLIRSRHSIIAHPSRGIERRMTNCAECHPGALQGDFWGLHANVPATNVAPTRTP